MLICHANLPPCVPTDPDDDLVSFSTDAEMTEALRQLTDPAFKVHVKGQSAAASRQAAVASRQSAVASRHSAAASHQSAAASRQSDALQAAS